MPTYEQWLANIRVVLAALANREMQECRWLAPGRHAWECPEELINSLNDVVYDGFIEEFSYQWTMEQKAAATSVQRSMHDYCVQSPTWLNPEQVLADPAWHQVQADAKRFLRCFPDPSAGEESAL